MVQHQAFGLPKCQYFRRRIEGVDGDRRWLLEAEAVAVFEETLHFMECQLWSPWTVPFTRFFSDFLCRFVCDVVRARSVWEQMAKSKRAKDWQLWTAFIEWECSFGEVEPVPPSLKKQRHGMPSAEALKQRPFGQRNLYRIRSLYHRAIQVLDAESGSDYLCDQFIRFEQRCGDLDALHKAQSRCRRKRKEEEVH